jgi:hypothetical protein
MHAESTHLIGTRADSHCDISGFLVGLDLLIKNLILF